MEAIPSDVWEIIFEYLTPKDAFSLFSVSKCFQEVEAESRVWEKLWARYKKVLSVKIKGPLKQTKALSNACKALFVHSMQHGYVNCAVDGELFFFPAAMLLDEFLYDVKSHYEEDMLVFIAHKLVKPKKTTLFSFLSDFVAENTILDESPAKKTVSYYRIDIIPSHTALSSR